MAKKKTWKEKLDDGREPHVERLEKQYGGAAPGALMLISTPREVQAFVKKIPEGRAFSQAELRQQLAKRHNADAACPISTGIFLRIVSEAAWEEMQEGKPGVPFWRVVEPDSPLAKKLACGPAFIEKMRRQEGIVAGTVTSRKRNRSS